MLARGETRAADAQLQGLLRSGTEAYAQETNQAERLADQLARDPRMVQALRAHDVRTLQALTAAAPRVRIETSSGLRIGVVIPDAAERTAPVVDRGRTLGRVFAAVPLDAVFARRLGAAVGLRPGQRLVVGRRLSVPLETPATVNLDGSRFRALAAYASEQGGGVEVAVLSPQAWITSSQRAVWLRVLAALAASLALVGFAAYLLGRSIVAALGRLLEAARGIAAGNLSQRVPAGGGDEFGRLGQAFNKMAEQLEARLGDLREGRRRLRDATIRFGEALASTHDADQLLRSIVETAVELTRATAGHVETFDGRIIEVGDGDAGPARLELPLRSGEATFGSLVLFGAEFTIQDLESASLLVGHAVVALENARLHRILERQALVDALTGLANRRAAERALAAELARSSRFDSPVALVLADLDDFKAVNDVHGHPAGDEVLREVAVVLESSIREADVAARWGGEEFCLILPGTDAAGAAILAERVRTGLEELTILAPDGTPIKVTASFGIASRPELTTGLDLLAAADAALYEAKRAGKNTVELTSSGIRAA